MTTNDLIDAPAPEHRPRRVTVPGKITRTRVPGRDRLVAGEPAPEFKREVSTLRREDILRLVGAGLAALCTTAWLFGQILPVQGFVPYVCATFGFFLLYFIVLISFDDDRITIIDRVWGVFIHAAGIILLLAMGSVVVYTFIRGSEAFMQPNFWTEDLSKAGPLDPLVTGGMAHAAVGTLIMIAIALAIAIPLGVLCAVFMAEFPSPFARVVRTVVEAMTALPSIICGLFIYSAFILFFEQHKSGFAASLAITIMILPIIIRSSDVVLRLVPQTLKEASLAMGASHFRTIWHVVLPSSRSGLVTAIVLGTARGIGETSPVLLTAGYTTFYNWNPFDGPMVSLPFATFTLVKSPEPTQIARGFGAAAVLMVLVFILFLVARLLGAMDPTAIGRRREELRKASAARAARRAGLSMEAPAAAAAPAATGYGFIPVGSTERPAAGVASSGQTANKSQSGPLAGEGAER